MAPEEGLLSRQRRNGLWGMFGLLDGWLIRSAHLLRLVHMRPGVSYSSFAVVFGVLFLPAMVSTPGLGGDVVLDALIDFWADAALVTPYLSSPLLASFSLAIAVILILSVNRAWASNEDIRERLAQNLIGGVGVSADDLPDLRDEAIVAGLLLLLLTPFWLMNLNMAACEVGGAGACLYTVEVTTGTASEVAPWLVFTGDALFRALIFFDFPEVYDWRSFGSVTVANDAGSHLVMILRILIDILIITSILQVARVNRSVRDAIATLERESDRAVRVGSRIVGPLIAELRRASEEDPRQSKIKHENAARALERIRDPRAIHGLLALLPHPYARVRELAAQAIGVLASLPVTSQTRRLNALQALRARRARENKVTVRDALETAIEAVEAVS